MIGVIFSFISLLIVDISICLIPRGGLGVSIFPNKWYQRQVPGVALWIWSEEVLSKEAGF